MMAKKIKLGNEDFHYWAFCLQNKWLRIKIEDGDLKDFFTDNLFDKVAVYGIGALGRLLIGELLKSNVNVVCAVDRKAKGITDYSYAVPLLDFDDEWPEIEVIVVTPIFFYEISREIRAKYGDEVDIVAIDDIVDYCYERKKNE